MPSRHLARFPWCVVCRSVVQAFASRMRACLACFRYAKDNWRVVGDSLANLLRTFHLVDDRGALPLWQSA